MIDQTSTAAEVVLPCADLDAALACYVDQLGFRVEMISPADEPRVAVVNGHGLRLRLDRDHAGDPGVLRLAGTGRADSITAPNGTRIQFVDAEPPLVIPEGHQSLTISRPGGAAWVVGRAGMRYRDLLPDRYGGRFIASHIHIPAAGPVPDYVHFHKVRFQMIFVRSGWVRVVYEDQGEPFVMDAGDCVLQPPQIRHRVLECSADLEVYELGCPAVHVTCGDLALGLPTAVVRADRDFAGQKFVRHIAADAQWQPWDRPGFDCRDTGIGSATAGLAGARVVRPNGMPVPAAPSVHSCELQQWFVLDGSASLVVGDHTEHLTGGDCATVPAGMEHRLVDPASDFEFLEVTLPQ